MRRKKIGTMNFHGSVDITDPGYDRDVWCRIENCVGFCYTLTAS